MSNYIVDSADLTSVADAIRTKGGTSAQLQFPGGFADAIAAIPSGGGGEWTTDGIATGSEPNGKLVITSTTVRPGAFFDCSGITEIDAPNLTEAHSVAFYNCTEVERCNFPKLTTVYFRAFNFFGKSGSLRTIYLPKLTTMSGTSEIAGISSTAVAFANSHAQYVVIPALAGSTTPWCFGYCTNLIGADLGNCSKIETNCFYGSSSIETIVLRRTASTGASLGGINAFTGSPFASGQSGGTLYVPQSLISWYQSATNWSTILGYTNNQILPIEGSIYETQYADGTPIE